MAFIGRFNARSIPNLELALPTEAQWEYACRAGTDTATYAGPMEILGPLNAPVLDAIAWYAGNNGEEFERMLSSGAREIIAPSQKQYEPNRVGARPVGLKKPNSWGCYDMLGNVWEWCADDVRKYTADPVTDPVGSLDSARRSIRGGSWGGVAHSVRAAMRSRGARDYRDHGVGFRCARVY